jgi:hypothetical protein
MKLEALSSRKHEWNMEFNKGNNNKDSQSNSGTFRALNCKVA